MILVFFFPIVPRRASAVRKAKRDTGVFFCFVFCHGEENEEHITKKTAQDR